MDLLRAVGGAQAGLAAACGSGQWAASLMSGWPAVPGRDGDEPMTGDAGGPDDGEVRDPGGTQHTDADRDLVSGAGHA
jgi:hypothetical protein